MDEKLAMDLKDLAEGGGGGGGIAGGGGGGGVEKRNRVVPGDDVSQR